MYLKINDGSALRIAGALHIFPAEAPSIPDWLLEAFKWCDEVVFEHDSEKTIPCMHLPNGVTLDQFLRPDIWQRLSATWPQGNPFSLASMKPWAAHMFASVFMLPKVVAGVESQLMELNKDAGNQVSWLESPEGFTGGMDAVPINTLENELLRVLDDPDLVRKNFIDMHMAWRSRNLDAIYAVVQSTGIVNVPEIRNAVLTARNRAWVAPVKNALQSSRRTLVIVGALHLCGPDNLIELLETEGCTVSLISE